MNKHIDIFNDNDIKNIGHENTDQPRRLASEKNRVYDRFRLSDKEFYDEFKARHKYSRSERKDLIRMAKKIYVH